MHRVRSAYRCARGCHGDEGSSGTSSIGQWAGFVAKDLRKWHAKTRAKTLYIEPGSPWENGYCESFNSKLRDEFLNGEIFYSMKELRALAERWRVHYNTIRPHSSLGYRPLAPEAWRTHPRRRLFELEDTCQEPEVSTARSVRVATKSGPSTGSGGRTSAGNRRSLRRAGTQRTVLSRKCPTTALTLNFRKA